MRGARWPVYGGVQVKKIGRQWESELWDVAGGGRGKGRRVEVRSRWRFPDPDARDRTDVAGGRRWRPRYKLFWLNRWYRAALLKLSRRNVSSCHWTHMGYQTSHRPVSPTPCTFLPLSLPVPPGLPPPCSRQTPPRYVNFVEISATAIIFTRGH